MHTGRFVFSQLMDFLPHHEFNKCVQRYRGNHRVRTFRCHDQFLCMAFAQLTYRESLRDIVTCLHVLKPKLFHAGVRGNVSRTTLADANENRDWRIYADFAQALIHAARRLYADEAFGVELDHTVYALDSTTKNAVRTQIWIAVSVYVLVAIVRKRLEIPLPLHTILQILSLTVFEKMPLHQVLTDSDHTSHITASRNQLNLFS